MGLPISLCTFRHSAKLLGNRATLTRPQIPKQTSKTKPYDQPLLGNELEYLQHEAKPAALLRLGRPFFAISQRLGLVIGLHAISARTVWKALGNNHLNQGRGTSGGGVEPATPAVRRGGLGIAFIAATIPISAGGPAEVSNIRQKREDYKKREKMGCIGLSFVRRMRREV
jgi:hypothetical protein